MFNTKTQKQITGWGKKLKSASSQGLINEVNLLLQQVNRLDEIKKLMINECARIAAMYGHTDCLKSLIEKPKRLDIDTVHICLKLAAGGGKSECVKFLLSLSTNKTEITNALFKASENGHFECVRTLISVSDQKIGTTFALRLAAENGHTECVKILIPVSDCEAAKDTLKGRNCYQGVCIIDAELQRDKLELSFPDGPPPRQTPHVL